MSRRAAGAGRAGRRRGRSRRSRGCTRTTPACCAAGRRSRRCASTPAARSGCETHLARLVGSAEVLGLPAPGSGSRWRRWRCEAVAAAGDADCVLRVVWTGGREQDERGVGFALVTALPEGLEQQRGRGMSLASLQLAIGAHARQRLALAAAGREVDQLRGQHGGPAGGPPARRGRRAVPVGRGDRAGGADLERVAARGRAAADAVARPGHPGRASPATRCWRRPPSGAGGGGAGVRRWSGWRRRTRSSPAPACAR